MGASTSKNTEIDHEDVEDIGGQLYVSLKLDNHNLDGDLIPHVCGSGPLAGSWDVSKALAMERESTSTWELSFVAPPNHEAIDFKFLLKPRYQANLCMVEEGPNRLLKRGILQEHRRLALFRFGNEEVLDYKVIIKADRVSPFDLAASWRAYLDNLRPSTVRGIPDVSINAALVMENGPASTLELDLERYLIPSPSSASATAVYAANMTENPRSLDFFSGFSKSDATYSNGASTDNCCICRKRVAKQGEKKMTFDRLANWANAVIVLAQTCLYFATRLNSDGYHDVRLHGSMALVIVGMSCHYNKSGI